MTTTPLSTDRAAALRLLAPNGRLRAGINFGNLALAQRDAGNGKPGGVSVDLARELARELGVPCELVPYDAAGKVTQTPGEWEVSFLAVDPVRAERLAFTPAYVQIAACYMVHADSPLRRSDDLDAPGRRVAVGRGAAYDLHLTRTLKHAQLERRPTAAEAFELFDRERLDAAGGVRRVVEHHVEGLPHLRVLDDDFLKIDQALCVPRQAVTGLESGFAWLCEWVERQKASGFVAASLNRSGQTDATVAPPTT